MQPEPWLVEANDMTILRCLLAAAACGPVCFLPAQPARAQSGPRGLEQTSIFSEVCLYGFAGGGAGGNPGSGVPEGHAAMTDEEVSEFVPARHAIGWFHHTDLADYAVTLVADDRPTCAVRRMAGRRMAVMEPFLGALRTYAEAGHLELAPMPVRSSHTADGGDTTVMSHNVVAVEESRRVATISLTLTSLHKAYRGRLQAPVLPGGGSYEVKMEIQMAGR